MKAVIISLTAALLFAACYYKTDNTIDLPEPQPRQRPVSAAPLPKLDLKRDASLESEIATIAEQAKGRVGVAAVLLETGQAAELNGHDQFPMQSVYKLPIVMAMLDAESRGRVKLGDKVAIEPTDFVRRGVRSPIRDDFPQGGEFTVRELMAESMAESDGTASDVLMDLAGGPAAVEDYLKRLGIVDMHVMDSEKTIFKDWDTQYRNSASPMATIELLRVLNAGGGISEESRQELLYMMKNSTPGGHRLIKLLPKDTPVAHKTGTGGNQNGISSATNDVGIIYLPDGRHLLIAVYISDSTGAAFDRQRTIAEIAKAVWDRWVEPSH